MKATVLVIDHNHTFIDLIEKDLLNKYIVLKAPDTSVAMQLLKAWPVQIILCEIRLGGIDGYEFCHTIKSDPSLCYIPVIMMTMNPSLQKKIKALECGADALIEKPFMPQYLHAQIINLLNNRNKIKDFFANSPLAHMKAPGYSKADESFLQRLNETIEKKINDTKLDVDMIAKEMIMSRATLYRKIKAISKLTPNQFVHSVRFKKAAELLANGSHKVYQVIDIVGFNSQSNFTRGFSKQFGMTPTEYMNCRQTEN